MNEAMVAQEQRQTQEQRMDYLLKDLLRDSSGKPHEQLKEVCQYIDLLRRQAAKAKNQRQTLKQLHKAHYVTIMENRWLRSEIKSISPESWLGMVRRAKETLWRQIHGEAKQRVSQEQ